MIFQRQEERDLIPGVQGSLGERAVMIPNDVVQPRFETRLNLLSRRILVLLGERGSVDLETMGPELKVSDDLAALSVGWLARSRVVDLIEDLSGKLLVRIRRSDE